MQDKRTYKWLYKNSKNQIKSLIVLMAGNGLFAVSGVLMALVSKNVIDGAIESGVPGLVKNGFMLLGIILFQFLLRMICRYINQRMNARLEMNLRLRVMEQMMTKDYASVTGYHSGELMNRLTSDITIISGGLTSMLPSLTGFAVRLLGVFWVLCTLDKTFALVFIVGGISLIIVTRAFRTLMKNMHKRVQESEGRVRSFMQEILENILVVKIFNVEEKMCDKAGGLQDENFACKMKRTRFSVVSNSGISLIFSFGYLYGLLWGAYGIVMKTISFGTITAIIQLVGQIQSPISGLTGMLPQLYSILASAERLMELEDLQEERQKNKQEICPVQLYDRFINIEFQEISFRYDRDYVLKNASCSIEKGDFIVIGGISGIGKSTLLKLLLGVYEAEEGKILLHLNNGETLEADKMTRRLFSYVPQGNMLLSGTIKDNIRFVCQNASDGEIEEAARLSCAYDFICKLPKGFDTVVGEKGSGLSEGQIQRIAIARALLSKAPMLLLDEATSALDVETEKKLLQNIRSLKNKTCLIISHKESAFEVCQKEIRIQDGSTTVYCR